MVTRHKIRSVYFIESKVNQSVKDTKKARENLHQVSTMGLIISDNSMLKRVNYFVTDSICSLMYVYCELKIGERVKYCKMCK